MLWLLSASAALIVADPPARPPAKPPLETPIEARGPSGPLKGVLIVPADAAAPPVVLIIPGSGATDRDGDNPKGLKARPYRLLAEALAANGVASIRFDKRGMFESAGATQDANAVTLSDYEEDVRSWMATARAKTGARCVFLIGHSEGALVALKTAQRPADICGVVTLSGAGRPIFEVLREQLRANPANAPLLVDAERAIEALDAGQKIDVSGMHPALARLFAPAVQDFEISIYGQDPAILASRLETPLLIVQGEADLQVSVEDARRLKAADPSAELALIPSMNHVLKSAPAGNRAENLATYADPALPLAGGLIDAVIRFIRAHGPR